MIDRYAPAQSGAGQASPLKLVASA
jgi:hypothetical protein